MPSCVSILPIHPLPCRSSSREAWKLFCPKQFAVKVLGTGDGLAQAVCQAAAACLQSWGGTEEAGVQLLAIVASVVRRMTSSRGLAECDVQGMTPGLLVEQVSHARAIRGTCADAPARPIFGKCARALPVPHALHGCTCPLSHPSAE